MRDFVFAWRTLMNRRGFTAIAVLTLALGVGASTGMFSVIRATLLRPLPFRDPDALAFINGTFGPERQPRGSSYPESMDWRAGARGFTTMSVYDPTSTSLSGEGDAERVPAEFVSASFFDLLGAAPRMGRGLRAGDDVPGGPKVVVLSHELWRRRFGGNAAVLGRTLVVDGVPLTIVGVMPEEFRGLSFQAQLWSTHAAVTPNVLEDRGSRWLGVIGRLAPGTTVEQGEAAVQAVARDLEARFPQTHRDRSATVTTLQATYVGSTQRLLLVLFGAVIMLMLIACVNVTSLQLVRAAGRHQEMSLRHALGATRARLIRQLLAEGVVLSAMGGAIGLFAAYWALQLFLPLIPTAVLPPYATVRIDGAAAGFAVFAAALCGTISSLLPALRSSGRDLGSDLRSRGIAGYGTRGRAGPQQILVASEIALAFLVLVSAGLMLRSFQKVLAIDPGFRTEGVNAARVSLAANVYDVERRRVFVDRVLETVRALPGVQHAVVTSDVPLRGNWTASRLQRVEHPDDLVRYYRHRVSPDYFAALGIEIVRGRGFNDTDRPSTERVAVVGETTAARLWPGQDAVGQRIRLGVDSTAALATVVGVAKDVRHRSLTVALADDDVDVYLPIAQGTPTDFEIMVRTTMPLETFAPLLRNSVAKIDANVPVYTIDTLERALVAVSAQARFASFLISLFAVLALTLAAVGVYGVMAYYVSTAKKEIAIRLAVGAAPSSVRLMILRRGGELIAAGTVVGAIAAMASAGILRALLFGVEERDPVTYLAVAVVLATVAMAANYIPALRATKVDPQVALMGPGN